MARPPEDGQGGTAAVLARSAGSTRTPKATRSRSCCTARTSARRIIRASTCRRTTTLYRQSRMLPDGAERNALYRRMAELVAAYNPWALRVYPIENTLCSRGCAATRSTRTGSIRGSTLASTTRNWPRADAVDHVAVNATGGSRESAGRGLFALPRASARGVRLLQSRRTMTHVQPMTPSTHFFADSRRRAHSRAWLAHGMVRGIGVGAGIGRRGDLIL